MPGLEVAASALALANSTLEGFLKISAQLGADTDLAFIRDEFAMMQAFLKTAEKSRRSRPKRGKVMNTWVRQVRSLAHDVEDCLEDSTLHLDRRLRRRQSSSSLRFFFLRLRLLPRKLKARHRIAGDIKKLRARVEELSGRNVRYRLIDDVAPPASSSSLQPPADRQLLITRGRHDQMWSGGGGGDQRSGEGSLADLIAGGGDGIRVISVWGRDDHGRASISVVKEAYDDDDLGGGFTWRAWVKVTHPFSPNEFVRSLVVQFHAATSIQKFEAMSKMEKTMMAEPDGRPSLSLDEEFVMLVKENKYIFVLDDLADVEEWIWIKTYLLRPDLDKNGSRIVVRTQHKEIAMMCLKHPVLTQVSDSVFNYELPDGQPCIYLMFTKGQEESGSHPTEMIQGVRPNSVVAGESSETTTQLEGSQPSSGAKGRMQDSRESMSVALEENRLVGRDSDESELIELVLSAKTKECISVCGLGGVGKTALVKSICQSQRLRGMFEMVAWIPMQEPFNFHEFTRTVEHKLTPNKKKILPTKRTDGKDTNLPDKSPKGNLIVLDDVSSKKDWARIKSALLEDRFNMSRVIITTREPSVDKLCERSHNLKPLRDGDALQLFRKKVNIDLHDKFSGVAIDIVKECGGLPQLIIIVAGLLQEKYSVMEWKKTRDHLTAELQNNPKLKDYDKTLTSGYKNLSSSLKSCFLYLSVFPHDSIIRRRRLVRRWTAEGYSSEKHGKSVEEVADKQFQDLMSRNMVLPCGTTISKIGNSWETYEFEFQSLMHGVSRRKSAKENLILVLDENEHSSLQAKSRARHLTVLESWDRKGKKRDALESIVHLPHLRSLTVFGKFKSFFISRKMRLLRVLDLEDANGLRDRDLSSIGKLYHLRYLSLRGSVGIFHLPDSIGYLSNLETLDIKGTMVTKLPSTIVKLQKLKYLRAGIIAYGEDDSYELVHDFLPAYLRDCFRTEHVYEEMDMKMVVTLIRLMVTVLLRGFDVCGVKAPRGIGKLKALNTLGVINVARGKNVLKEIKKLTQLRKLGITGIKKDHCEELGSTIYSCSHLQTLSLRAEGNNGLVGCLDDISPPEDLQSLKLYGNLGELPEWIGKLQRLTKLTLRSTLLEQDGVQDLGKLPTLTSLHLLGNSFKGEELNFQRNKFASLLVLEIDGLSGTKAVEFEEETMARLKLLKVNCWWNTVTDCCSFTGILHLPNLMEVLLIGLDCGESAEGFQGSDLEAEDVREWLAERKPLWDENRAFKEDLLNQLEGNQKRHILKMEY